jgi:hypothetical protein
MTRFLGNKGQKGIVPLRNERAMRGRRTSLEEAGWPHAFFLLQKNPDLPFTTDFPG